MTKTRDHATVVASWCAALLMVIYLGKFIVLKLTGWIFNVSAKKIEVRMCAQYRLKKRNPRQVYQCVGLEPRQ